MIVAFNIFLFFTFFAFIVDVFVNGFSVLSLICVLLAGLITALFSYKCKIYQNTDELNFLNLNIYNLYIKKYLINFVNAICQIYKPFLINFEQNPVLIKVEIPRHKDFDHQIFVDIVNMSQELTIYKIEKNIAYIYAVNQKSFDKLNLLRLSKDLSQVNENNIV